jgi:transposase
VSHFIGIDIHRKYIVACVMDEGGAVARSERISLEELDELVEFFGSFDPGTEVVLEATMGWMWLTDLMESMGLKVTLAHMQGVRVIAESRCKTDRIDARTLADLLRTNYLPRAYLAPADVRDNRMLLGHRQALVKWRTAAKNCVHAILVRYNVHFGMSDIFGVKGTQMLRGLEVPERARVVLDSLLECIEFDSGQIKKVEKQLKRWLGHDGRIVIVTSLPGVGELTAYFLLAEIGTIERFVSPAKLVSYCGMCPSTRQSGDRTSHGKVAGGGRSLLKWSLIEAAHTAVMRDSYFATLFHRTAQRKGTSKAYVAVAHAMAEILWHMLKEERPYRPKMKRTQVGSGAPMTVHA